MSNNLTGKLALIVGPSGVGKGTAISLLKKRHPQWVFPITATTRDPRPDEVDGQDYFFLSKKEFDRRIDADQFLEWAEVHGKKKYGLLRSEVIPYLEMGNMIIRELDYQGCKTLAHLLPDNTVSIFLLPPSKEVLADRIRKRSPITDEEFEQRMESMKKELEFADKCDYAIQTVDDIPERTVKLIEQILEKMVV